MPLPNGVSGGTSRGTAKSESKPELARATFIRSHFIGRRSHFNMQRIVNARAMVKWQTFAIEIAGDIFERVLLRLSHSARITSPLVRLYGLGQCRRRYRLPRVGVCDIFYIPDQKGLIGEWIDRRVSFGPDFSSLEVSTCPYRIDAFWVYGPPGEENDGLDGKSGLPKKSSKAWKRLPKDSCC